MIFFHEVIQKIVKNSSVICHNIYFVILAICSLFFMYEQKTVSKMFSVLVTLTNILDSRYSLWIHAFLNSIACFIDSVYKYAKIPFLPEFFIFSALMLLNPACLHAMRAFAHANSQSFPAAVVPCRGTETHTAYYTVSVDVLWPCVFCEYGDEASFSLDQALAHLLSLVMLCVCPCRLHGLICV